MLLGVIPPGLHPVLIPKGKAKGRGRVFNGASVGSVDAQKPSMPLLEPFSSAIMSSFRLLMLDGPEVLP